MDGLLLSHLSLSREPFDSRTTEAGSRTIPGTRFFNILHFWRLQFSRFSFRTAVLLESPFRPLLGHIEHLSPLTWCPRNLTLSKGWRHGCSKESSASPYVILVVYLLSLMGVSKTERKRVLADYEPILDRYKLELPPAIFGALVRTETAKKLKRVRFFVTRN